MRILFVHQNFPGQFKHLAPALAAQGHEVHALGIEARPALPGVRHHRYKLSRGSTQGLWPLMADFEAKLIRGEACAKAALALHKHGFTPDLIVCHPGWGEALFLKDVWPRARMLSFLEFYYNVEGADVNFDPEFANAAASTDPWAAVMDRARLRSKNANNLLAMDLMDWGLCPTAWQKSTMPQAYHDRISVVFDGVDTNALRPDPTARVRLATAGRELQPGDEVITFVNRNLEPYRGYHVMMRALPEIQRLRPNAIVVVVGGDDVSYGARAPDGQSWKQVFLDEVKGRLDMARVRFVGKLPYDSYVKLLQVSACHVYLTYPFVLSWSCIEAMSIGALVVGSDTQPVREVIEHGRNGLLVDFHDPGAVAATVAHALENRDRLGGLREQARRDVVSRYDLQTVCLPRQLDLVRQVAG